MKNYNFKLSLLAGLGALALATVPAKASVVFVFEGTTAGPAGSTNFNYDVDFVTSLDVPSGASTDRFVNDGNTFGTLYDIPGLISVTLNPATAPFTSSTQLVGRTPVGIAPTDSASLTNITLTYTGPTVTTTPGVNFPLVLTVGSTFSGLNTLGQYSGQDTKNAGSAAGSPATNFGFTTVPASVPEPGTVFATLGGLGLLALGRIRRNKK